MAKPEVKTTRIELSQPIDIAGVETSSLVMREPKAGDYRLTFSKTRGFSDVEQQMHLCAELCELTIEEYDQLAGADLAAVNAALEGFTTAKGASTR